MADFITVYIEEAHPSDGWSFDGGPQFAFAKSEEDRLSAAMFMQEKLKSRSPLVCDTLSNESNLAYAAIPERLYIVYNNRIVYCGGIGPFDYNPGEVESFLFNFNVDQ